jgi:hypothetical protein
MKHSDEFLELIRQTEEDKLDNISRFFSRIEIHPAITIRTTAELAGTRRVKEDVAEKTFKPDTYLQLAFVPLAFGLYLFIRRPSLDIVPILIVFILCLTVVSIIAIIKKRFFDNGRSFIIRLDNKGISIDDTLFEWKDIYQTAILTKREGRSRTNYLIIAYNDMENYEKYELTNYSSSNTRGFSSKLAQYIEYFKPLTVLNSHTQRGH